MDHDDALEELELAAIEPMGLDRLMAGDTPTAAAVAAHLAGCERCTTELERLRRGVPLLRDVVRTTPPADLRERTLAFVREQGIPRGRDADAAAGSRVGGSLGVPVGPAGSAPVAIPLSRGRGILPWVAAIAAAVVLSVAATSFIVEGRLDQRLTAQSETIDHLGAVTVATLGVTAEPDARRVELAAADDPSASGTIVYSPATTELVVVATGLAPAPAGMEYRCWVERGGRRESIGKMFFGGDLAYWVGDSPSVAELPDGATFGVSLGSVDGDPTGAEPVIVGEL